MDDGYNPFLDGRVPNQSSRRVIPSDRIERPGEAKNIVWQTRAAIPTTYEDALADALVACFEDGLEEIGPLVQRLNEMGIKATDGAEWSKENFERVMARLGA